VRRFVLAKKRPGPVDKPRDEALRFLLDHPSQRVSLSPSEAQ
jgi:hypothetical protein